MATPSPFRLGNRLIRAVRRARLGSTREAQISVWQQQADAGEALMRLRTSADWPAWIAVLTRLQGDVDRETKNLLASHERRLVASAQWCAFEALKREVNRTIADGQQARTRLAQVQTPPTERPT